MTISPAVGRIIVAFMDALLPDKDVSFSPYRQRVPEILDAIFEPEQFDDPTLRRAIPLLFRVLNWLPVVCFWLIYKPLPLTRLSIADRQRLFARLASSRVYLLRNLFVTTKLIAGMALFHMEETWPLVGYDAEGALPRVINRNPAYEAAESP